MLKKIIFALGCNGGKDPPASSTNRQTYIHKRNRKSHDSIVSEEP